MKADGIISDFCHAEEPETALETLDTLFHQAITTEEYAATEDKSDVVYSYKQIRQLLINIDKKYKGGNDGNKN
jgi:transposase